MTGYVSYIQNANAGHQYYKSRRETMELMFLLLPLFRSGLSTNLHQPLTREVCILYSLDDILHFMSKSIIRDKDGNLACNECLDNVLTKLKGKTFRFWNAFFLICPFFKQKSFKKYNFLRTKLRIQNAVLRSRTCGSVL